MTKQLNLKEFGLQKTDEGYENAPLFASLKAEDLGKPGAEASGMIKKAEVREFETEKKVVLTLVIAKLTKSEGGDVRSLPLNKTNLASMLNAFGEDLDAWEHKIVDLKVETTKFKGKTVPCVRIYEGA